MNFIMPRVAINKKTCQFLGPIKEVNQITDSKVLIKSEWDGCFVPSRSAEESTRQGFSAWELLGTCVAVCLGSLAGPAF